MSRYDGTSKEQHKHRKRSRSRSIERSGYGEVDRREVSSQRDKERSKPESDDGDFNFLHYKQGTKEYDDFWVFVEKYQIFQKRQPSKPCASSSSDKESRLGIPSHYDKRYRINVGLVNRDVEDFLKKGRLADADIDRRLTKDRLAKLKKVRTDQENLPIYQFKQHIIETVSQHQVIIIAGDTGCGKSTQYLLQAGFTNIACTQPRRIACVSLSKRVGYETLNEFGTEVAFQVRFEKTKTRNTKILFLTEGLLLRQMTTDPHLSMYNVIVIDEVHERHIHTDYLLGVLQCLVRHRDDVKVPGRLYPIEMEFCPIQKDYSSSRSERLDPTPYLLVEAARALAQQTKSWIILPLHSGLSVDEQEKVFDIAPEGVRKCIVSTNIAETSVTIDGVRFIVDSGKVKEMSFDPKYKMQRLQEFWISRASAEQRKGRAGRTGPGQCFRLYEEREYEAFQEYTTPEIRRVPLDSLVLQMISMGLPDPRKFPFIEPPSLESLDNAVIFLRDQGALHQDESLTPIGLMLSKLPVDVVIGKMLIMGSIFHMIDPVLSIAAAMSVQSPFTSKIHTDVDSMVKAEGRGTKKWCQRRGLEEQRFYEMTKLKRQFKDLLQAGEGEEYLSSAERRQKHGERKRLSQLRREQRNESKKRKVLKLDQDETSNESRRFTLRDVNLLKIILCSGLYPQVSVADDCNTLKSSSEQAFHTKSKPFLLLHPTSVFSYKPELLHPKHDLDAKHDPADLKGVLTPFWKPTSHTLSTRCECQHYRLLICDGWLELVIPEQEEAQEVMSSVIQLRATWQNLLKLRLEDTFLSMESERQVSGRSRKLERILAAKLTEFLSSDVRYKLRRVLAAEMKNVYVGPDGIGESPENILPASSEGSRPHPIKGGIQMNDLVDDGTASVVGEFTVNMQRHWACPRCNESMVVSIAERLEHEAACQAKNITAEEREGQLNPHRKSYFCADCDKQLSLSVIEILKHKKSHRTGT
ncbi:DHX34-like protein [Mya arenaria]|uniref:DHX34-like protein n=1 Tax=Mya arenaria TaxID=6604 RepID=A0ABY7DMG4_MYAAR|nr:DHX34-like protein [Mya arenaria]